MTSNFAHRTVFLGGIDYMLSSMTKIDHISTAEKSIYFRFGRRIDIACAKGKGVGKIQ